MAKGTGGKMTMHDGSGMKPVTVQFENISFTPHGGKEVDLYEALKESKASAFKEWVTVPIGGTLDIRIDKAPTQEPTKDADYEIVEPEALTDGS